MWKLRWPSSAIFVVRVSSFVFRRSFFVFRRSSFVFRRSFFVFRRSFFVFRFSFFALIVSGRRGRHLSMAYVRMRMAPPI